MKRGKVTQVYRADGRYVNVGPGSAAWNPKCCSDKGVLCDECRRLDALRSTENQFNKGNDMSKRSDIALDLAIQAYQASKAACASGDTNDHQYAIQLLELAAAAHGDAKQEIEHGAIDRSYGTNRRHSQNEDYTDVLAMNQYGSPISMIVNERRFGTRTAISGQRPTIEADDDDVRDMVPPRPDYKAWSQQAN